MILLALTLLTSAPAQSADAPAIDPDIVVVAQKARKVRFNVQPDRRTGATVCRIKTSSGDAIIDAKVCEIARTCASANVTKAQRDELIACFEPRFRTMVAERAAAIHEDRLGTKTHAPNQ